MKNSIVKFNVEKPALSKLTKDEKKIIPILEEAIKKVDQIFLLQENSSFEGAALYPHNVTKSEIERAAKKDPKIFSPFTVVEKDKSGKLIAIDYHVKYAKLIEPVVNLLRQASRVSENKSFKNYLEILSNSLTFGSYQQADIAWLAVKNSNVSFIIGAYERNLDKLFFIKRAYQAHLGFIDHEKTESAKLIRDVLYTNIGPRIHRVTPPSIVDIWVQNSIILSGFLGRAFFSEQHLPSDADTTERYGSRILGYLSVMDYKFEKVVYPIFKVIFDKNFKERYSEDTLRRGHYYYVLLTSIARQLHRYKNSRERLRELFPIYDEANAAASGVQHAKHLVLKGVIDQRDLEVVMVTLICRIFSEWVISKGTNIREHFLKGDALTFNFLVMEGALQEKEGISWPNFAKMFFSIENLSTIFTRFLEEGTYWEAQEFLSKYLTFDIFKAFEKRLSTVKSI